MMRTIVALLCMTVISSPGFAHGNEQHVMGTAIRISQESSPLRPTRKPPSKS